MILAKKIKVKKFSVFKNSFFCFKLIPSDSSNKILAFWISFKRIVSRDRMVLYLHIPLFLSPSWKEGSTSPNFIKRGSLPLGPTSGREREISPLPSFAGFHPS
jgi:hypothetical protein